MLSKVNLYFYSSEASINHVSSLKMKASLKAQIRFNVTRGYVLQCYFLSSIETIVNFIHLIQLKQWANVPCADPMAWNCNFGKTFSIKLYNLKRLQTREVSHVQIMMKYWPIMISEEKEEKSLQMEKIQLEGSLLRQQLKRNYFGDIHIFINNFHFHKKELTVYGSDYRTLRGVICSFSQL